MSGDDLQLVAFNLALLTYNLGVVLYSLPIPLKSIKRWGINLITDGISACIMISCFTLILDLTSFLQNLLGANWSNYFTWIGGRIALIFSGFSVLTYISGLLKYPYVSFLSSPINIVVGYLSATFSALRLLAFLGSFILTYHRYLMLLGIALYSIPMRIGKNAGAYLVAMSLVMYVGLPLMPAFVESFQASITNIGFDNPQISGYVVDASGGLVPNAVIKLYKDYELVGTILVDESGRYVLGGGYDLLPKDFNYDVVLELYGFSFTPALSTINDEVCGPTRTCVVNLTVPGLLTSANGRLLIPVPTDAVVSMVELKEGTVGISITSTSNQSQPNLLLAYPRGTVIRSLSINGEVTSCGLINDFNWYGIQVSVCEVVAASSPAYVEVSYESLYIEKPTVNEKRIIAVEDVNSILIDTISLGMALIFSLVFLPSLYMTLLLSISASLARFLGGRGLPLRMV